MRPRQFTAVLAVALFAIALPIVAGAPPAAAVRSAGAAKDPANKLAGCEKGIPLGGTEVDVNRCFTHRFNPEAQITSAVLRLSIKPQSLADTDTLQVAVTEVPDAQKAKFADCDFAKGAMAGCVILHVNVPNETNSLTVNLVDIGCDKSVKADPDRQAAVLRELRSGVVHFMLQDDTVVFSSELAINEGPPSTACGTSPASLPGTGGPTTTLPSAGGSVQILTEKDSYSRNERVVALYSSFPTPKPGTRHWVNVVPAGSADDIDGQWDWVEAGSGRHDFGPLPPGSYETRAYLNWQVDGRTVRARHAFTVTDSQAPTTVPPACPQASGRSVSAPAFGTPEPATVPCMTLQVGLRRVRVGERSYIPVYAINAANVGNVNYHIEFDPNLITIEDPLRRAEFMGSALGQANTVGGRVLFGVAQTTGATSISAEKPWMFMHYVFFTAKGKPGDKSPLHLEITTLNAPDGTKLIMDRIDGMIEIVGPDGRQQGDCDGNGVLNEPDALCALQISVELLPKDLTLDMDRDDNVTSRDSAIILQRSIGKI